MGMRIVEDDCTLSDRICLALGGEKKVFTRCFDLKNATEKRKEKKADLLCHLAVLLGAFLLILGNGVSAYASPAEESQTTRAVVRKSQDEKLEIYDDSGFYLIGEKGTWYLRDREEKPVTGTFYLPFSPDEHLKKGYYYFEEDGRLSRKKALRRVTGTLYGKEVDGLYYFGDANARLSTKSGWRKIDNEWYCFSGNGYVYQNQWAGIYYMGEDGKMLKSSRTPDGNYVGYDGKKCEKDEVRLGELRDKIAEECKQTGGDWSVYVKDLDTGDYLVTNETPVYSASVIKPFVMASVYDCMERGTVQDSPKVQSLLKSMITVSDNESYNELVRLQGSPYGFENGAAVVNQYLEENGYTGTSCRHTLHPSGSRYTGIGGHNTVTAKDCGVLLEKIYQGECVSASASSEMLELLLNQQRRGKIPAGLPKGTKVANKTGETDETQHDMAIVWGAKCTYVISVTSVGVEEYRAVQQIQKISDEVYKELNP